jgi:hypothetical protein
LSLATTAELCCPRQFDSSEWFVCESEEEGKMREGGWTDGEDKPVESILHHTMIGRRAEELFNRTTGVS